MTDNCPLEDQTPIDRRLEVRNASATMLNWTRRDFFSSQALGAVLGVLGMVRPSAASASAVGVDSPLGRPANGANAGAAGAREAPRTEAAYADNIYTKMFGVTPVVGAAGALSSYGNSRMRPEVIRAMADASEFLVDLDELNRAAGRRIAEIMKAEAAMVTSCAAGSMMLGAAACLTGTDRQNIDALPHPTWPRRVCLMQKAHRFLYDRAYRAAGMTIVDVETRDQLINAIDGTTAMIAGLAGLGSTGLERNGTSAIALEDLVAIGKKAGVPVLIDAAGQLPPVTNLTRFTGMGADLVCFSGGKALGGPSSTGILAGRRDLIEAAAMNGSPNQNVGRGMKVNREEIVGLVVALESYLKLDHDRVFSEWTRKSQYIADQLRGIPGLKATLDAGSEGYAVVVLDWDPKVFSMTVPQAGALLKAGRPRIVCWTFLGAQRARVQPPALEDGDEIIIAKRLRRFFLEEAPRVGRG
ncbi:MAG: aminotransferase class V-fold PLP-dependent enzyme [Vicinamibacterales bacterium]